MNEKVEIEENEKNKVNITFIPVYMTCLVLKVRARFRAK